MTVLRSVLKPWFMAARPKTLPAGVCPVILGMILAFSEGGLALLPSFCAMMGAIFIQIGTNFANDYFDFKKGADTDQRLGPVRVTQSGLVSESGIKWATAIAFLIASLFGLYLIYRGGLPIVLIGVASIISGILYTGGPYPLGYLGLGEVFVWIFFGPVAVAGTYYINTLHLSSDSLILGGISGLFSVAILAVNNYRDRIQDEAAGKRTLAVRFGPKFARAEYILCVTLGFCLPSLIWGETHPSIWMTNLGLAAFLPIARRFLNGTGRDLNPVLAQTGLLLLLFTLLFGWGYL